MPPGHCPDPKNLESRLLYQVTTNSILDQETSDDHDNSSLFYNPPSSPTVTTSLI